jgi:cytochrome c peroxidase
VHGAYPNNRIAKRNPQSYTYATYFPPLHFNQSQADFYGGNFWDGRATRYKLRKSCLRSVEAVQQQLQILL